MAAENKG